MTLRLEIFEDKHRKGRKHRGEVEFIAMVEKGSKPIDEAMIDEWIADAQTRGRFIERILVDEQGNYSVIEVKRKALPDVAARP